MATLVLSAAGAAIGGSIGGAVLGVSAAAIGQAVGAAIGSSVDQRLIGGGSSTVHTGKVKTFRVMGAAEGEEIPQVFGKMRVGGQVIWASRFLEKQSTNETGGKSNRTTVVSHSYSVSLALALCEGEITRIGRVWADGNLISLENTTWRLYLGSDDQSPDPLIEAIEGAGNVPAFRGTAYLVLENLELAPFGNRIPQFNVEVVRRVQELGVNAPRDPFTELRAVALVPGTGEYSLGTTPVRYDLDKGVARSANQNSPVSDTDFVVAMDQLAQEMPQVDAVSLVVSWFGNDLRCSQCKLQPKVEQKDVDGTPLAWDVNGVTRQSAEVIGRIDGKSVFGGTPSDISVVEAISKLNADGIKTMFYPFILMDVPPDNELPDPYSGASGQPTFPWRGRITSDNAPGTTGTNDKTAAIHGEVQGFFGSAEIGDFSVSDGRIVFTGDAHDWGYRRFILHYAHLCVLAGGVHSFIIGSEMRGITRLRDAQNSFPAVQEFVRLAQDVRAILGASSEISYAADWSEYFGYRPSDASGDVWFNLDPLWSSDAIDFIGIDNYMPLSDWRDEFNHADAAFGSIYDQSYLEQNVSGGEGFDWYYGSEDDRDAQIRTPIQDTAHGEDWIFRYKDLKSWWENPHHNRPGGVRDTNATGWVPQSKPIRFTELGCPAVDKGTNQPNVFVDPKSSEGNVPYFSSGARDDFIQYRYFQAHFNHWSTPENNPVSTVYSQPMVDLNFAYAWAYDTRPWPEFPNRTDVWSDGINYGRGHWLSGRIGAASLAAVVSHISYRSGFADIDVSELHGSVTGYLVDHTQSARQTLQPLMMTHGFDSVEVDGQIVFRNRFHRQSEQLDTEHLVDGLNSSKLGFTRASAEAVGSQIKLSYYDAGRGYQVGAAEAAIPTIAEQGSSDFNFPVALSHAEGTHIAARFLSEAHVSRDEVSFTLPPSKLALTAGDVVTITHENIERLFRIDRLEETGARSCQGVRIEEIPNITAPIDDIPNDETGPILPGSLYVEFLDLPMMSHDAIPHAPFVMASASPWVGDVAIYTSPGDTGYTLSNIISSPATVGTTQSLLPAAASGLWARGAYLEVRVPRGTLQGRSEEDVLNGANLAALRRPGDTDWEVFQFQSCELIGPGQYKLGNLLRGQFGTDAVMPAFYPSGSDFVLLDGSGVQPYIPAGARGLSRHYRIGPASLGYDDPGFSHHVLAFHGVGLRPFSPVHIRGQRQFDSSVDFTWIRRSRSLEDGWEGADVPLAEDVEQYLIRISKGSLVLRETTVDTTFFSYSTQMQNADNIVAPFSVEVAQISTQYGPGPFERIEFNG